MESFYYIIIKHYSFYQLWACLAAASLHARELNAAEIALAAIESVDKV